MVWLLALSQAVVVLVLCVLWQTAVLVVWLLASLAGAAVGATQRAWRRCRRWRRPREVTW